MNIQITEGERNINLSLPTGLILNRIVMKRLLKHVSINGEKIEGLSGRALEKLTEEIRRIQKKNGTWELVEVYSAKGENVKIIL